MTILRGALSRYVMLSTIVLSLLLIILGGAVYYQARTLETVTAQLGVVQTMDNENDVLLDQLQQQAGATLRRVQLLVMSIGGLILACVVIIGLANVYYVLSPLATLQRDVEHVASGQLERSIELKRRDEFGGLAQAVNKLITALRQSNLTMEQQVAARTAQLRAGAEIARAASSILDPQELLQQTIDLICDRFNYYYAAIFLLDESATPGEKAIVRLRAGRGEAGQTMLVAGHKFELGDGMVGWVCANQQPRIALDVGADAAHFANPLLPDTRSEIALPLQAGGHILGALDVQSTQEAAFDESDIVLLQGMADQIAVALENARLFAQAQSSLAQNEQLITQIQESLKEATTLYAASQAIALAQDKPAIFQAIVENILKPGIDVCMLLLFDAYETEQPQHVEIDQLWQRDAGQDAKRLAGRRFDFARFPLRAFLHADQAGLIHDQAQVPPETLGQQLWQNLGVQALALVPLNAGARWIGALAVGSSSERTIDLDELRAYQSVALQAATALENQRLAESTQASLQELSSLYRAYTSEVWSTALQGRTGAIEYEYKRTVPSTKEQVAGEAVVRMPLTVRGQEIGMLEMEGEKPSLSEQEQAFVNEIGVQTALALENARLFEQTQQQVQDLETVNSIGQMITSAMNREHLLYMLYQQVSTVCNTQDFYVGIYAAGRDEVTFPIYYERGEELEVAALPIESSLSGQIVKTGKPLLMHTRQEIEARGLALNGEPPRSYLGVPMQLGERLSGLIAVQDFQRERAFNERHMRIITAIATQAATALENTRLFEEARHRALQLATAAETGKAASSLLDMGELLASVVELIRIRFGYYHASIFLLDDDKKYAVLAKSTNPDYQEREYKLAVGKESLIGWVSSTGRSHVVRDTDTEADQLKSNMLPLARSELAIPLRRGEDMIGALDVQGTESERFSQDEVAVLELLADQVAIAIENARLYQETQRRARLLQAAAQVGQAITSILDPQELQKLVVTLLQQQLDLYYAGLFLIDAERRYAVLHAGTGEPGRLMLERGHRLEVGGHSMVGWTCANRRARIALDAGADAVRFDNPLLPETRTEMALPLIVGDEVLGALDVQSTRPAAFSDEDARTLQTLANQVAVALRNATLVTEVRHLFEEQKQAAEKLREMDRLKTQFLANMSHELRTPLNSIIGFSRVILKGIDGPLTDMQKQDLTAIHTSGQHLLGLINDILDISKIEAGKMELSFEEVDFKEVIKGVLSTGVGLVKDKPVELRQKTPDDLPFVWADPVRSRQVVLNLLSNAAKFTERGAISIEAVAEARFIRVSVRDTGIGIPKEKLDTIFEAFTQADASTTRRYGGTGLGLAISRRFIEMHGGDLWVESEVGVGTTFTFTLPRARPARPEEVPEQAADVTPGKKIILAIEDEPSMVTMYRRYLEQHGYAVIGVSNSQQAIEMAQRLKPHAITLDILMPDKDGWSIIQELKQNAETSDIPVIIASILSEQGKGFSLGAADYLVKPITEEELLAALKRLDGRPQTRILAIDDRPEDILLIRRMLEAYPRFVISEAHSGKEGLEAVHSSLPDLILLDLMMPEMDGFAVLEALKAEPATRDIPIIVVTAKTLTEEDRQRLNDSTLALLSKGQFTEQDLLTDVANALGRMTGQAA
jgi:GAF domain-containing protein/DNA-binding response OmpR family regulator/HAMP domain-containing protein/anti-sigma regulatory factor (Ser/Thr protein kinase)